MLNQLLQTLGHTPTATNPKRTTYKSPWNTEEKTPSCFIFKNKEWNGQDPLREFNYKDNSTGNGGNIFDFVMKYFSINNFSDARKKVNELLGYNYQSQHQPPTPPFSFNQQKEAKENRVKIVKTQPLQNKALIEYLEERKISFDIARKYLSEVYYAIENKNYFAISFVNNNGGREVRNKYFKASLGKKDITTISPIYQTKQVKIFEGFIDYLSYLDITKSVYSCDYIILNSLSLLDKTLKQIEGKYEMIELYLDNDDAGDKATKKVQKIFGSRVNDKRKFYEKFKDVNEYLLSL